MNTLQTILDNHNTELANELNGLLDTLNTEQQVKIAERSQIAERFDSVSRQLEELAAERELLSNILSQVDHKIQQIESQKQLVESNLPK